MTTDDERHLIEKIETTRDELNLQIHLAEAELRDEWHELEKNWKQLQQKLERGGKAATESGEAVATAIRILGEELLQGYQHVREAMR